MQAWNAIRDAAAPLAEQWGELRRAVSRLKREAQKAYAQAADEMDKAATRLGLPSRERVIDVGDRPSLASRAVRAGAGAVAVGLTMGALLSLSAFCLQLFLAFLLVTRGLGIRVDVSRPAP